MSQEEQEKSEEQAEQKGGDDQGIPEQDKDKHSNQSKDNTQEGDLVKDPNPKQKESTRQDVDPAENEPTDQQETSMSKFMD